MWASIESWPALIATEPKGRTMRMFVRASCLVLISCFAAHAAEPAVIPVWPNQPPGEPVATEPETAQPNKPGEHPPVTRLTNVSQPTLTVYLPAAEQRNGTAVVICPGGGFNILAWNKEGTEVAEWFNSIGVTALVLKYRTPTSKRDIPWLAPAQDAQRAIRIVRSRAAEWNLTPDRIGLLGFSAGGSAAANASIKSEQPLYDRVDSLDEGSCRPDFVALIYPAYLVDAQGQLKPDLLVTSKTPPMFLAHAFNDGITCENSVQLFLALKKGGVASDLHVYSAGGHGFGLRASDHVASTWPKRCEDWLRSRGLLDPPRAK
jgi:acetyl esterase/lipase